MTFSQYTDTIFLFLFKNKLIYNRIIMFVV